MSLDYDTIYISSHNLSELEQMCDVIGLINNGKLIEFKTMDEIDSMLQSKQKIQLLCNYPNYAALLLKEKYKLPSTVVGNSVVLSLKEKNVAPVISYLIHKKIKIYGMI